MRYLGIDPGASGAVALISDSGEVISVVDAVDNEGIMCAEHLFSVIGTMMPDRVVLEKVHGMNKGGGKQAASTSFKFGASFGTCRGVICALGLPFVEVWPQTWKAFYGITRLGKEGSLELCRRMHPDVDLKYKKHADRAEAILIAEYGRNICWSS